MSTIRLSGIIPTPGQGRPLARALASVAPQLRAGDEVLVIGDCLDGPLPEVEALVRRFDAECDGRFRYLPFNGGQHSWGHFEINHGMSKAQGDYLTFLDDDDIWTPDAFATIRRVVESLSEPCPLLFRFQTQWGAICWDEACRDAGGRRVPVQDHIGGHCAVFSNIPERLGRWSARYAGDYDFIRSTLDLWPNKDDDALWYDDLIAIARPKS